jgi:predicted transcriptional regulator of viral defense system
MQFSDLLTLTGDLPLFETGLLLAGNVDPDDVRRQLSRWAKAGRIRQLRRGLYTLAPPYQKTIPHPFVVANALVTGSYVSGQSALAYYGLIPEYVPVTVSVTPSRPAQWENEFHFHHLAAHFFFGYQSVELAQDQHAFIAMPEKALLDLAHLTPNSDSPDYLSQLRLQNLERLNLDRFNEFAKQAGKPKWRRVANLMMDLEAQESSHFEELA